MVYLSILLILLYWLKLSLSLSQVTGIHIVFPFLSIKQNYLTSGFHSTFFPLFSLFFIDVPIQLSPFSHHHFFHPTYTHLPPSITPLPSSMHGSLIHVHLCPLTFFPTLFSSPLPSPLVTVSLSSISMSLVIFCLFVCLFC